MSDSKLFNSHYKQLIFRDPKFGSIIQDGNYETVGKISKKGFLVNVSRYLHDSDDNLVCSCRRKITSHGLVFEIMDKGDTLIGKTSGNLRSKGQMDDAIGKRLFSFDKSDEVIIIYDNQGNKVAELKSTLLLQQLKNETVLYDRTLRILTNNLNRLALLGFLLAIYDVLDNYPKGTLG